MAVAEAAAREAAEVIMKLRFKVLVKQKDGGEGPVTEADLAVRHLWCSGGIFDVILERSVGRGFVQ